MTATVLPFPVNLRRDFIANRAERKAFMKSKSAGRYLTYQLQVQAEAMRRRGVVTDVIQRELKSMEEAVRREFLQRAGEA